MQCMLCSMFVGLYVLMSVSVMVGLFSVRRETTKQKELS